MSSEGSAASSGRRTRLLTNRRHFGPTIIMTAVLVWVSRYADRARPDLGEHLPSRPNRGIVLAFLGGTYTSSRGIASRSAPAERGAARSPQTHP